MKYLLWGFAFSILVMAGVPAQAQQVPSAIVVSGCGTPPQTYNAGQAYPLTMDTTGKLCDTATVTPPATDPCATSGVAKISVAIAVVTATTTQLVAISGSKAVYVCGFSITIAPSATAADTALFEYGTSTNCTGTNALTGTFGNGDLTSAAGVAPISYGGGGQTIFTAPASNALCIVTTGTAVSVQGVLTYVQA